jgi:DNA-binding CsgD family transcriptional regulator
VVAATPPSRVRARALARLGWVRGHREGFHVATEVFTAALAEPSDDLALRIEIEEGLAWSTHTAHNMDAAREHARTALALAERLGEPSLLAGALSQVAFLDSVAGEGIAMETIERASALGRPPGWSQILGRPDWVHALLLQWAGQLGVARERFRALYQDATDRGNEHSLPFILYHLARIDLLTGEWDRALGYARDCRDTTLQSGQVGERPYYLLIEALVEAHLGMVEPARAKIAEGLALVEQLGVRPAGFELLAIRGFLELSLGEVERADQTFGQLADGIARTGLREPALFRFNGDAVEAKVALGRTGEAATMLDQFEALAAALDRTWALMVASRCRGLLHAANGETDAAYQALERALGLHDRMEEPFERARTLLVLGSVQRRDRKKRAARDSLQAALAVVDRLGAVLWSARADAELARVGGRAPSAGLTPTEERVAQLIAAGLTYRQAADTLFISPKTVQWNLSKIYRKLGVRSRAELAARLPAGPRGSDPSRAADQGERRVPR